MEQEIGRYQIKKEIGRGGMALVYLAYDPLMARNVSLKLLPRQLTDESAFRRRFQLEARFIANLEHPAIVPVYDFGEHEDHLYLVMRYMNSGTLRRRMNQALPIKEVVAIIQRLAPALDKAHTQNIIHRDVKPDNVLFDEDELPYLADFGIARLMESSKTVTISGTPAYMSPEQVKGDKELNGRSDIYSLGVMTFEMLAGRPPYDAETSTKLMMKHLLEPVPDISTFNPDLPPGCQLITARAMAKEPERRFGTATALAWALQELIEAGDTFSMPAGRIMKTVRTSALAKDPSQAVSGDNQGQDSDTVPYSQVHPRPTRPALMYGLLSLAVLGILIVGLALSGMFSGRQNDAASNDQAGPAADTTPAPTQPPLSPTPPTPFAAGIRGLLLAAQTDSAAADLISLTQDKFKASLVRTGLTENVQVTSAVLPARQSLPAETDTRLARWGVWISVSGSEGNYTIQSTAYFSELTAEYGGSVETLQVTADALLQPFAADSLLTASQLLADRLTVIANVMNGFIALDEGSYDECSRRFSAVLSLLDEVQVPFNRAEASHSALAICLSALGQQEAARDHYLAALEINPDYALAHYGLGNYYYGQFDYETAQNYYQLTIDKSQIDPLATDVILGRAYVGLGNIAIANQAYEEAILALNQAIALEPELPSYYLTRAIAYAALSREAEATADLNQCIDLATNVAGGQTDYYRQLEQECRTLLASIENETSVEETATATPTAVFNPSPRPSPTPSPTPSRPPTVPPPTPAPTIPPSTPTQPPTVPPQPTATQPPTVPPPPPTATQPPTVPPPTQPPPTQPPTVPPPTSTAEPP